MRNMRNERYAYELPTNKTYFSTAKFDLRTAELFRNYPSIRTL